MDIHDSNLVQKILMEKWKTYEEWEPLSVHQEDLDVAITLFTKMVKEKSSQEPSLKTIKLDVGQEDEVVIKIKEFVKENAYTFRRICQTGFPFSLLDPSCIEVVLKARLDGSSYDSILSLFMNLEKDWMDEKELNKRFSIPFQRLKIPAIVETCDDLTRAYSEKGNNKAGYYLLWLIKQTTGCSYEIPEKKSFHKESVSNVLSQFVKKVLLYLPLM